jgi:hypothetical protein
MMQQIGNMQQGGAGIVRPMQAMRPGQVFGAARGRGRGFGRGGRGPLPPPPPPPLQQHQQQQPPQQQQLQPPPRQLPGMAGGSEWRLQPALSSSKAPPLQQQHQHQQKQIEAAPMPAPTPVALAESTAEQKAEAIKKEEVSRENG